MRKFTFQRAASIPTTSELIPNAACASRKRAPATTITSMSTTTTTDNKQVINTPSAVVLLLRASSSPSKFQVPPFAPTPEGWVHDTSEVELLRVSCSVRTGGRKKNCGQIVAKLRAAKNVGASELITVPLPSDVRLSSDSRYNHGDPWLAMEPLQCNAAAIGVSIAL